MWIDSRYLVWIDQNKLCDYKFIWSLWMRQRSNRTYTDYLASNDSFPEVYSLVEQLTRSNQQNLLRQTIGEVAQVLARDYPPLSKVLAMRLVKELFLSSKESIINAIDQKLLDEVAVVAMYRDNYRGANFFVQTNYYKAGDEKQRDNYRSLGSDYVGFCKDSIASWAKMVAFTTDGHPSRFSQKYQELKKKGVEFGKDKTLYKQTDKEGFQKVFKVEFFNSESSMSESMLNQSNCEILVSRQLDQCQRLDIALKDSLQPLQANTDWRKLRTIIERINIFFHESSIKMLQELKQLNADPDYTRRVLKTQSMFGQVLEDYEYLLSKKLKYPEFFRMYGHKSALVQDLASSSRMPQSQIVMSRQKKIQLTQTMEQVSHFRTPVSKLNEPEIERSSKQKILQMKLTQIENQYQTKIQEEKQKAETRISEMKRLIQPSSNIPKQDILQKANNENGQLRIRVSELLEQVKEVQIAKEKVKDEYRKLELEFVQLNRNYLEKDRSLKKMIQEAQKYKSMTGQYEGEVAYLKNQASKQTEYKVQSRGEVDSLLLEDSLRFQKKIDNLVQERDLLKEQLGVQRKKNYQNVTYQVQILKQEIERMKSKLREHEQKETALVLKMDIIEVENIKLKEQLKIKQTISDSLKKENQWINKTINQINETSNNFKRSQQILSVARSVPRSEVCLDIKDYLETGMEGSTYYDVLSREFQIKYKRACFKKKELLCKQYNLQVGCISQAVGPNRLLVTVFLTNNGSVDLGNFHVRILNPTTNQIQSDIKHFDKLDKGQQRKVYVDALIQSYPIGPVVFKLEYLDKNVSSSFQLLLPVSIIKLVRAETRQSNHLNQINRTQFKFDHKIVQNLSAFGQYFPNVSFDQSQGVLRMTMLHQHTRTQWDMDLEIEQDYLTMKWGKATGFHEIQEYYWKTLRNLLVK